MMLRGEKYSIHYSDYREFGGNVIFRWSDNELNDAIGVPVLQKASLTVDQLVELIKQKESNNGTEI